MKFDINGKFFDIAELIIMKYPGSSFTIGDEIDSLQWFSSDIPKPTLKDIEEWVKEFNASKVAPVKDWRLLLSSLQSSQPFFKAYNASKVTLPANTAFTLLMTVITTTNNEDTLIFALAELRQSLKASNKLEDFTAEEIEVIIDLLNKAGFDGDFIVNGDKE